MTLHEIVTRTNDAIGATGAECIDTLAPWVVMNAHYEVFHDWIEHSKGKQSLAQYANKWEAAYRKFNSKFFRSLPEDLGIELVEVVYDDFVTAIHNDMARLIVAVYSAIPSEDNEFKRRYANAYLCYEFSIIAQRMFGMAYYDPIPPKIFYAKLCGRTVRYTIPEGKKEARSQELVDCETFSRKWFLQYCKKNGINQVMRTPKLVDEECNLVRACVKWVFKMNKEIAKQ